MSNDAPLVVTVDGDAPLVAHASVLAELLAELRESMQPIADDPQIALVPPPLGPRLNRAQRRARDKERRRVEKTLRRRVRAVQEGMIAWHDETGTYIGGRPFTEEEG